MSKASGIGVPVRAVVRQTGLTLVADGWRSVWPNEGKRRTRFQLVQISDSEGHGEAYGLIAHGPIITAGKRPESLFPCDGANIL